MISEREPVEAVSDRELVEKWRSLVFEPAAGDVRELLAAFPERRQLSVPFESCGIDYRFTAPLVNEPDRTFEAGRRAIREFAADRFEREFEPDGRVYLRVRNVPDSVRRPLASIGTEHLNRLVVVSGTVAELRQPQPRVVTARFECERCGNYTAVGQPGRRLRRRTHCSHCSGAGTLALAPDAGAYVAAQTLSLEDGERTLPVALEHDLTGRFAVGDRIDVTAIPRARLDGETTVADLELEAICVERRAAADGGDDRDRREGDSTGR